MIVKSHLFTHLSGKIGNTNVYSTPASSKKADKKKERVFTAKIQGTDRRRLQKSTNGFVEEAMTDAGTFSSLANQYKDIFFVDKTQYSSYQRGITAQFMKSYWKVYLGTFYDPYDFPIKLGITNFRAAEFTFTWKLWDVNGKLELDFTWYPSVFENGQSEDDILIIVTFLPALNYFKVWDTGISRNVGGIEFGQSQVPYAPDRYIAVGFINPDNNYCSPCIMQNQQYIPVV